MNHFSQKIFSFRWETVANFINQHSPGSKRTAKESLAKAKDLQKMGEKYILNKKMFLYICLVV